MSAKELHELDEWLNQHLDIQIIQFKPTVCYADAMQVLEKCCKISRLEIEFWNGEWRVNAVFTRFRAIYAETLPLAICIMARKFFDKP